MLNWVKSKYRQLARERTPPGGVEVATAVPREPVPAEQKFALGCALRDAGRLAEAIAAYTEAIDLRHDYVDAIVALAHAHAASGNDEDAADQFHLALAFDPACAPAHLGLGRLLRTQGSHGEAVEHFRRAAGAPASPAEAWFELALSLEKPKYAAEAREAYQQALALRPDYAEAAVNLGLMVLVGDGDPAGAEPWFRRAVASDPTLAAAEVNLGLSLQEQGRFEEAIETFDRAIPRHPDVPDLVWHRAMARLLRGDYGDAWEDHEARRRIFRGRHERVFPYPEWQGEPVAGRTLLIYAEQGVGDEIMFASCVPDLIERGARCVIECDARLASLYARSFSGSIVHGARRDGSRDWLALHPGIELQCPVGSLPRFLRRSREDFPRRAGYLVADAGRTARWRDRLAACSSGLKVGISWQGGTAKTRGDMRSVPLELWGPVLRTPGACFVSLQRNVERPLAVESAPGIAIQHWPEATADLEELAALLSALDLVVTVCSSVAQLAGALGRPTLVLLAASPNWWWSWEGERNAWHPSVRALRQRRPGNWEPVLADAAAEIARRLRGSQP